MKVVLGIEYTPNYPDEVPRLTLQTEEGELEEKEILDLISSMKGIVRRSPAFIVVLN